MAETHPQACVSSRKFGEKTANSIACENYHLAGPYPLYFTHKNTRRTQKSTFPDLPERVWTADAGHTTQPPAEKISHLFDTFIRRLWVGGSGRTFSDCLFPTLLPFRIDANLSLLAYHVSGKPYFMLAGASGAFLPFSADCKNESFSVFFEQRNKRL